MIHRSQFCFNFASKLRRYNVGLFDLFSVESLDISISSAMYPIEMYSGTIIESGISLDITNLVGRCSRVTRYPISTLSSPISILSSPISILSSPISTLSSPISILSS